MPFDSGSISFQVCSLPQSLPEDLLAKFSKKKAPPLEHAKDEPQLGWVSGRHLLETQIDDKTAYLGGYIHLSLRQAQRKIPAQLLRAQCRMAELELMAEKGLDRIGRKQKKQIKEDVTERLLPKMPPQLSGIPFVVDSPSNRLYVGATSDKQLDTFMAYFHQTLGFEPVPLTPDVLAAEQLGKDPSDLPRLNFAPETPNEEAGGTLGQNFLTWLWFFLNQREGALPKTQLGEFHMAIDGPLVLVAEGAGALETSLRKGLPTLSAEAKAGLSVGKKLRQAKLSLGRSRQEVWTVTVDADNFVFRSLKVPPGEALDPGSAFEERMTNLYVFHTVLTELFKYFLTQLTDTSKVADIQKSGKRWVEQMDGK